MFRRRDLHGGSEGMKTRSCCPRHSPLISAGDWQGTCCVQVASGLLCNTQHKSRADWCKAEAPGGGEVNHFVAVLGKRNKTVWIFFLERNRSQRVASIFRETLSYTLHNPVSLAPQQYIIHLWFCKCVVFEGIKLHNCIEINSYFMVPHPNTI